MFSLASLQFSLTSLVISRIHCDLMQAGLDKAKNATFVLADCIAKEIAFLQN